MMMTAIIFIVSMKNYILIHEYADNYFKWSNDFNGEKFSIEYVDFIENVHKDLILDDSSWICQLDKLFPLTIAFQGP